MHDGGQHRYIELGIYINLSYIQTNGVNIHTYSLANIATLAEPVPVQNIQAMLLILNLLIQSFSECSCKAANIDWGEQ